MQLNDDIVVVRNPDVVAREFDDQAFVMHPHRRELHNFNHTSWAVWQSIDGRRTVAELAANIVRDYGIGHEQSREDVLGLVESLIDKDLVRIVHAADADQRVPEA